MSQKTVKKTRKIASKLIVQGVFDEFATRESAYKKRIGTLIGDSISYKKRIDELLNQRKYLIIATGMALLLFLASIIHR